MSDAYLGIDLGTSGVKVVVLDRHGVIRGSAAGTYPLLRPFAGAAESEPERWWRVTCETVRAALADAGAISVAAIGVDGQMHGLVLADGAGNPVRPAITWADGRAEKSLPAWRSLSEDLRARLANPLVPGMAGPILTWLLEYEPESVALASVALLPKDWLRLRLTGRSATDPSDASATLLWDIPADGWASDVVDALGVPADLIPPVLASADIGGDLTPGAAAALGLPPGVPVAVGAGDTAAALLATNLAPGQAVLTVGTGAQFLRAGVRPIPRRDPVGHLYRAAEPHSWYTMVAIQNAGLALDWARTVLRASWPEMYAALDGCGTATPPLFVPYLTRERMPPLNGRAAGWDDVELSHDRSDLLAAAATGVAYGIRHAIEQAEQPLGDEIHIAGGGTAAPQMRQLLADVFNLRVVPLAMREASASGAAQLAAAATEGRAVAPAAPRVGHPADPGPQADARLAGYTRYLHAVEAGAQP